MSELQLKLTVRTPSEVVLELSVSSIRVPTETGQVGVRPRTEPLVLAVEPGLVLVRREDTFKFIGTAGGLLRCDGVSASLLTPLAVAGEDEDAVIDAIEQVRQGDMREMEARATLSRLQSSILRELREGKREEIRTVEGAR